MNPNFDKAIKREGTYSLKWEKYKADGLEPFWLADMDFATPKEIIKSIENVLEQEILGYTITPEIANTAVKEYLSKNYNWQVETESIVWIPGIVPGIEVVCRAYTEKQRDEIITFTPIYPPFLQAPLNSSKKCIQVPMKFSTIWEIDFEALENSISENTAIILLSSPQNPTGRVFSKEELTKLVNICEKYQIIICSDEIHCDIIYDKNIHTPTAQISQYAKNNTITFMSASKTYNMPGVSCAYAIIESKELRDKFIKTKDGIVPYVNIFGYYATATAYSECGKWLKELIEYLKINKELLITELSSLGFGTSNIESTYLAWINCNSFGENYMNIFKNAGIAVSDGKEFGLPGYIRFNFAVPRIRLINAIEQLKNVISN